MMLIPIFLQMLYFLFFMSCFYKLNKSKLISIILMLVTTLFYLFVFNDVSVLGKIVFTSYLFLHTMYLFDGSIKAKLQSFLLGVFVIASSEFVAVSICSAFNIEVDLNNIQSVIFLTIFTQLLNYLIGGTIINLLCRKKYFRNIPYLFYPFILIICFIFSLDYHIFSSDKISFISILFILSTFICIITISNMAYEIKKIEAEKKIEKMKIEEDFLKSKYDYLDENYQKNFKYFHDLFHFFNELTILAKERNYNDIIKRIDFMSKETLTLFSEIYSNSPSISSLITEYKDIIKDKDIVIVPTIKSERITSLSLLDETNMLRLLFQYVFDVYSENYTGNKMILIKSDTIGQQKILTFSFISNKKNEESLNKLISMIKENYTNKVKAEYIKNSSMIEIIIIFS